MEKKCKDCQILLSKCEHNCAIGQLKYKTLFDCSYDAITILDNDFKYTEVNKSAIKMFGVKKLSEIIGKSPSDFSPKYQLDKMLSVKKGKKMRKIVLEKGHCSFEWIHKRTNGEEFFANVLFTKMTFKKKNLFQATIRDITKNKKREEQLRQSEEKFHTLTQNIPGVVYRCANDVNWTMEYISKGIKDLTGFRASDLINNKIISYGDIIHKDDRKAVFFAVQKGVCNKCSYEISYRIINKDGVTKWVFEKGKPVLGSNKKVLFLDGIIFDITKTKEAERKLKEREQFLASIVDNIPNSIFIKDAKDLRFVRMNKAGEDLFGYKERELLGKNDHDFFPKKEADFFTKKDRKVLKSGKMEDIPEERIHTRFKGERVLHTKKIPLYYKNGKPQYLLGISVDITEKKKAEEDVSKFKLIADRASYGSVIVDLEGNIEYINKSFAKMHGYSVKELTGKNLLIFHNKQQKHKLTKLNKILFTKGGFTTEEVWHTTKKGKVFPVLMTVTIIKDNKAKPLYMAATAIDITQQKKAEEKLKASESKMKAILNHSPAVIYIKDVKGKYILINKVFENLFHISNENIQGKKDKDIFPEKVADKLRKVDRKVLKEKKAIEVEEIIPQDDKMHSYISLKFPLYDGVGEIYGICGISTDITERTKVVETIRVNEEFKKIVIDSIDEAMHFIDKDFIVRLFNNKFKQWCKKFKFKTDVIGKPLREVFPFLTEQIFGQYKYVMKTGKPVVTHEKNTINGRLVITETRKIPVKSHEKVTGVLTIVTDITERTKIANALKDSENSYRSLFESSMDAIMVLDAKNGFKKANEQTVKMFKCKDEKEFTRHSPAGLSPIRQLDGRKSSEKAQEMIQTAMRKGSHFFEWTHKRVTGEDFPANVLLSKIEVKGKEILQATVRDVTKRKEFEQKILESQKEVQNKNKDLVRNQEKLKKTIRALEKAHITLKGTQAQLVQSEKLALLGQLAAGIAHEINNPMGFISSNMETLDEYVKGYVRILEISEKMKKHIKEHNVNKAIKESKKIEKIEKSINIEFMRKDVTALLEETRRGVHRIKNIVKDLSVFARKDKGDKAFHEVENIVESIINIIANELKYKGEVKRIYNKMPLLWCNAQKIGQVIMNLLANATQAITGKGEISIKTYKENNMACIEIGDTGEGIEKRHKAKLFDPFFTTKEVGKGTGLGLSISYDIVKQHKGEMKITSERNRGTTVLVKIPFLK